MIIQPILLFYMLCTYTEYPIIQSIIRDKTCQQFYEPQVCQNLTTSLYMNEEKHVIKQTSHWILYSTIALTVPAIIANLFLGSWGDTKGRRAPLLLASCGSILSSITNIVWSASSAAPLQLILLSSFFTGVFGGFAGCISACMSYVTEYYSKERRTKEVSLMESMVFIGGTIGPFLGGLLVSSTEPHAVFIMTLILHVCIVLYVVCKVPELGGHATETETLLHRGIASVRTCIKSRCGNTRAIILLCLLVIFINSFITAGVLDTSYLFASSAPISMSRSMYSYYSGVCFGLSALVLLLVGFCCAGKIFDAYLTLTGLISKGASLIVLSFVKGTSVMFVVPVVGFGSAIPAATIRSILSKKLNPEEQGKLFGLIAAGDLLFLLLASVTFNLLYPIMNSWYRGSIFIAAGALLFIAALLIIWVLALQKRDLSYQELGDEVNETGASRYLSNARDEENDASASGYSSNTTIEQDQATTEYKTVTSRAQSRAEAAGYSKLLNQDEPAKDETEVDDQVENCEEIGIIGESSHLKATEGADFKGTTTDEVEDENQERVLADDAGHEKEATQKAENVFQGAEKLEVDSEEQEGMGTAKPEVTL